MCSAGAMQAMWGAAWGGCGKAACGKGPMHRPATVLGTERKAEPLAGSDVKGKDDASDEELDVFGRRRAAGTSQAKDGTKASSAPALSKEERQKAALARLRAPKQRDKD